MEKILITGGCGFIGCNLADYFIKKGYNISIFDNLSREGVENNLKWLEKNHKNKFKFIKGDVRNIEELNKATKDADIVFHTAAQVAVTTSVLNPYEDFKINALGTVNVLESARKSKKNPVVIFTSTNKVYGETKKAKVITDKSRYKYKDLKYGISENENLDFYSPYGCSKGCADQYVRDYHRIYGLNTVVLRMSCIYGKHQQGNEDQGWVAHFAKCFTEGKEITIYGDGKQVRDILYIDDLVNLFDLIINNTEKIKGEIFNIGGGVKNAISLLELIEKLEILTENKVKIKFSNWRPGDQKVYITDIRKVKKFLGWEPMTKLDDGLIKLIEWLKRKG